MRHEISLRSVLLILAVVAAIALLARIWETLLILVVALVIAGTFSPIVTWLERRGIPRPLALALLLIAMLAAVVGLGALIIPAMVAQIGMLAENAPAMQARLADLAARVPLLSGRAEAIRTAQIEKVLAPVGEGALRSLGTVAQGIVVGVTTVVIAFYLISDHERVQGFFFALLPRSLHVRTARVLLEMETVVGGYMRGQAVTSLAMGTFAFLLLTLLGIPSALPLAIFAAFADLVPLIGPVLVIAPSALVALTVSPVKAAIAVVAFVIYGQFEGHLLLPRVYGQSLRLSPLAVIVALLIGAQLLGIVGALLALPLAAGLRVLVEQYRIALPGEQPGEREERAEEASAERAYAAQAAGTSAVASAMIATEIAEELQDADVEKTGRVEQPAEEQADPPHTAPPLPNPARR